MKTLAWLPLPAQPTTELVTLGTETVGWVVSTLLRPDGLTWAELALLDTPAGRAATRLIGHGLGSVSVVSGRVSITTELIGVSVPTQGRLTT